MITGSNLTNIELNLRNAVSDQLSLLVGFRYINLNENFDATLIDRFGARFGNYTILTRNDLFGGQAGGDYSINLGDRLRITGMGKVGLFGSAESQTTSGSFLDVAAADPKNAPAQRSASLGQLSFVGQLGLQGAYQINQSLALRAGYQVMWIEGLTLAPDQITASDWATGGRGGINTHGGVFMHGALVGFDFRW